MDLTVFLHVLIIAMLSAKISQEIMKNYVPLGKNSIHISTDDINHQGVCLDWILISFYR